MTNLKREFLSCGAAFVVMVAVATAAFAIPIPWLREVLVDHTAAVGVWTLAVTAGWATARTVHYLLD